VPKAESVKANLEAFAHAIESRTPYPISGEDMVNNIALLESIIRGARTGQLETV
jgi:predicted dehydrogenase